MRSDYFNSSHLPDPTAYAALENISREERQHKRNRRRRKKHHRKPAQTPKTNQEVAPCSKP